MRKIRNNQTNRMSWEGETITVLNPGFTVPDSEQLMRHEGMELHLGATAVPKFLGHANIKKPW